MAETGLNQTELGKMILAACFINDLGTVLAPPRFAPSARYYLAPDRETLVMDVSGMAERLLAAVLGRLDALLARCGGVPEPAWPGSS